MKSINIDYKILAKLYYTTKGQISNWVKAKKLNPEDLISICELYSRNYAEIRDRIETFHIASCNYDVRKASKEESILVEKMYKEWGMEDKIYKGSLFGANLKRL